MASLEDFQTSWGAIEHILYFIPNYEKETFTVKSAMPCLDILLREITSSILASTSIPDVPLVNGFLYEHDYVKVMQHNGKMTVKNKSGTEKDVVIDKVIDSEAINQLQLGMLHHLRYTYPVIDAIGYLRVDGTPSLVFVQISLSEYSKHFTKMDDLNTTVAPEDNSKTIFEFSNHVTIPKN